MKLNRAYLNFIFLFLMMHVLPANASNVSGKVIILDQNGKEINDSSNVVVFVDGVEVPPRNSSPIKISQKNQTFTPSVLPIVKNQEVEFVNDDILFHNVFSLSKAKRFDLGVYKKGLSKFVRFDKTGLVKVYCNIHPNMVSNILVLNNPHFTVTDSSGHFQLNKLPEPPFQIRTWYAYSDSIALNIQDTSSLEGLGELTLTITKKIKQHSNKFGKPYKEKY